MPMRSIECFLYPDALGLDIVGPLDVFSTATELLRCSGEEHKGYRAVFSAEKPGLVKLIGGIELEAKTSIGKCQSTDIFLVPGGLGVEQVIRNPDLIQCIRSQAGKAKHIVSVCGGAFILAACGLLNGRKATTHWQSANDLACQYPDIDVIPDAIYIRDGKFSTSAGVTAGIDLALALVEEELGSSLAMDVARKLVVYLRRSGGQSQFSVPMELRAKTGKQFIDLHDWMLEHLDQPISVETMAERVAMSPRNFSRSFKTKTGITPGKFLEFMRIEKARELLESCDASIEAVARTSGFFRQGRLRRAFIRQFGISPSQYRIHFNSTSTAPFPSITPINPTKM